MEAFFIYLLKSAVLLSVFAAAYALLLRQTTFLGLNRLYLLLGLFASLLLPLVHYSYDVTIVIPAKVISNITEQSFHGTESSELSIFTILFAVYLTGIAVSVLKRLYAYGKIILLINSGFIEKKDGYKIVVNENVKSPFSVLNYIFLNTTNLSEIEREAILKHEIAHIKQRHWIDLLLSECMLLLQWFNPISWFYSSLQKENHEFLADKAVVESGIHPALYKAVLLNQQFQSPVFSFVSSLNNSNKSKRLIMVTKTKSSSRKKLLILVLIPIFATHLWVTATPNYIVLQPEPEVAERVINNNDVAEPKTNSLPKDSVEKNIHKNSDITSILVGATDTTTEIRYLIGGSPLFIIDGKEVKSIKDIESKNIESVSPLYKEEAIAAYGEKGKDGVVIIKSKKETSSRQNKQDSRCKYMLLKFTNNDSLIDYRFLHNGKEVTLKETFANSANIRIKTTNIDEQTSITSIEVQD